MNKAVIELQNIKRNFQVGDETVHACTASRSPSVKAEFVTLMGTSGSGKSTLLNTLGCLDTPTSGEYLLDGISVRTMSSLNAPYYATVKSASYSRVTTCCPKPLPWKMWSYR